MSAIRFLSVSGVMTLALLTSSCSKPASPANTPSSTSATTAHQSEAAQGVPAGAVPAMRAGKAPSEDRPTVTLKVGSPAPPLAVRKWVKGEPIAKFAPGQLYVVEFWAAWCGPCVKAMPDITELAKKHQGKVTFIGMDVDDPSDEGVVAKVEKFVANQGDKIGYPIALDTEDGQMQKRWLDAAGLQSIPQSFVIDGKGTLVWIGHPGELDKVLDAVLVGKPVPVSTNDGEAEMKAMMAKLGPMQKALKQKDYATAMTHIEELLKMPGGAQFAPLKYQVLAETAGSAKANEYARQILDGKLPEGRDHRNWLLMTLSESVMTKSGKEPDYQFALVLIHQSLKHGPRAEDGYGQVILARATYHAGDKVEGRKIAARARKLVQDDKQMPDGFKQQCLDQLSTLK